jgi:hypothetical protein
MENDHNVQIAKKSSNYRKINCECGKEIASKMGRHRKTAQHVCYECFKNYRLKLPLITSDDHISCFE